jgi:small subunit ribosomal protein S2
MNEETASNGVEPEGNPSPPQITPTAQLAEERAQAEQAGLTPDARPRDPSQPLSVRELFESGVHFGHQTRRWNPKMRQYIYGSRSGIHIIDLDQTSRLFKRAFDFVSDVVTRGGSVLFVGTNRHCVQE